MKKEIYTSPALEFIAVECDDVVTTSTESTTKPGGGIPLPDDEW